MKIAQTKRFDNISYRFTGQWSRLAQGYYKAMRNKVYYYAPIYINSKGRSLVDMEQRLCEKKFIEIMKKENEKYETKGGE